MEQKIDSKVVAIASVSRIVTSTIHGYSDKLGTVAVNLDAGIAIQES